MIRRRPKTIAILCPACRQWVKPRRYDPGLHLCWQCAVSPTIRFVPAVSVRHLPRALRKGA